MEQDDLVAFNKESAVHLIETITHAEKEYRSMFSRQDVTMWHMIFRCGGRMTTINLAGVRANAVGNWNRCKAGCWS